MKSILIVDDEPVICGMVRISLAGHFHVHAVHRIADARDVLKALQFDLILLNCFVGADDGFDFCAELKKSPLTRNVPVLFISGLSDLKKKVQGFAVGADDYIVKPFEPEDILARVQARTRDLGREIFTEKFGGLRVEWNLQKVFRCEEGGSESDLLLTPTEFRIFGFFCKMPAKIVSRNELIKGVWGKTSEVSSRGVDKHVCTLRHKLKSLAGYIRTIPNKGYQFDPTRPEALKPADAVTNRT